MRLPSEARIKSPKRRSTLRGSFCGIAFRSRSRSSRSLPKIDRQFANGDRNRIREANNLDSFR